MGIVETIALTMGIGWASGINLYAAICTLGILSATGNIALPESLLILEDPMVIGAAGFMYAVEFFADKVPGVDTGWDTLHTFIRIPAGAVLAAGAVGELGPAAELAAGLVGGSLAAGAHATKAGSRALINTSPEPFTNWTASMAEDVAVIGGLWMALQNPVLFLAALVLFILLIAWLLPKLLRGIRAVFRKVGGWLGISGSPSAPPSSVPQRLPSQA